MSEANQYYIRGIAGKQEFKMVRGEIKRVAEARGEDTFDSIHVAIFQFAQALRKWRYCPQGITFQHHMREGVKPPCPL